MVHLTRQLAYQINPPIILYVIGLHKYIRKVNEVVRHMYRPYYPEPYNDSFYRFYNLNQYSYVYYDKVSTPAFMYRILHGKTSRNPPYLVRKSYHPKPNVIYHLSQE